jgi:hypothetical protein
VVRYILRITPTTGPRSRNHRRRRRPAADDDRLEIRICRQELDRIATARVRLHRDVVADSRDDDLPVADFLRLVHGNPVAVEHPGIAHAHPAHLQQVVRARLEQRRVDRGGGS